MHGDLLGEWLPLALADLFAVILAVGGQHRTRREILSGWGFPVPKTDGQSETDRALAQLFSPTA